MTAADLEQQKVAREQFPIMLNNALTNLETVSACGNAKGERHRFYEYSSINSCRECLEILEQIKGFLPILESEIRTIYNSISKKSSSSRGSAS